MKKNKKLVWKVLRHDFNSDTIVEYNVLGEYFIEDLLKRIKSDKVKTYNEFKDLILSLFRYYYMSRTEYEVLIGGLHTRVEPTKIDVYYQLCLNIDILLEYIIKELDLKLDE